MDHNYTPITEKLISKILSLLMESNFSLKKLSLNFGSWGILSRFTLRNFYTDLNTRFLSNFI
jgi:hypothetical protein